MTASENSRKFQIQTFFNIPFPTEIRLRIPALIVILKFRGYTSIYMDDYHYITNFNTSLSPKDEAAFQQWIKAQSEASGRDMYKDLVNYDMRGAFKDIISGKSSQDERGHFPDDYKKPNHPTFSDERIYHNTKDPKTGEKYIGGTWGQEDGKDTYTPSAYVLKMQSGKGLMDYFNAVEPDAILKFNSQ